MQFIFIIIMLASINFNGQPRPMTIKIEDIVTY